MNKTDWLITLSYAMNRGGMELNGEECEEMYKCFAQPEVRATIIEECAVAAEQVVPRHTECGNKIARAIRALVQPPPQRGSQG